MAIRKSNIFFILPLSLLILLFQNCQSSDSPHSETSQQERGVTRAGPQTFGNGGAYTGKLTLVTPRQVSDNVHYVVVIEGGVSPYKISSSQGNIQVVGVSGSSYELVNNFPQGVTSFELFVEDALGARVSAQIDIISSDNIFNYSWATAGMVSDNRVVVFDHNIRTILVFDSEGLPLRSLSPFGDRHSYFEPIIDISFDQQQNIYALEPKNKKIHIYSSENLSFEKVIDLSVELNQSQVESFTIQNNTIYIVDSFLNQIHKWTIDGRYLGRLQFDVGQESLGAITSVVQDFTRDLIYVTDRKSKEVKIFSQGKLVQKISSLNFPDGELYNLAGPRRLAIGQQGQVYLIDQSLNKDSEGEEWTLRLYYNSDGSYVVQKIYQRRISLWHSPTDCLSVFGNQITYCDGSRQLRLADENGELIFEYDPALGSQSTINEPKHVDVASSGHYFVVCDNSQYVVKISPNQKILWRKGGYGDSPEKSYGITDLDVIGDRLYVATPHNNSIKVHSAEDYSFLFEIPIVDASGKVSEPEHIEHFEDKIYILNDKRELLVYNLDGRQLKIIEGVTGKFGESHSISKVRDIAVDKYGDLYLLSSGGKFVLKINPLTENLISRFELKNFSRRLSASHEEFLYLTETNSVSYYDQETGEWKGAFGVPGVDPGAFNSVSGVDASGQYIYVTDRYNNRLQKISLKVFE